MFKKLNVLLCTGYILFCFVVFLSLFLDSVFLGVEVLLVIVKDKRRSKSIVTLSTLMCNIKNKNEKKLNVIFFSSRRL